MPSAQDKVFVELAVKNHLLTQAEGDQALAETPPGKDVASHLVEKGILQTRHADSLKKKTQKLMEDRTVAGGHEDLTRAASDATVVPSSISRAAPPDAATMPPSGGAEGPVLFGQIAVRLGLLTEADVEAAVARQRQLDALGAKRRFGEVLCDQKKLTPEKAREILAYQEKFILACPKCQKRYNVSGSPNATGVRCPVCSGDLKPASSIMSLGVQGTAGVPTDKAQGVANSMTGGGRDTKQLARRKSDADPAGLLDSEFNGHRVEKVLGRGGMGCVYLATQLSLSRQVALKVMLRAGAAKDEEKARFRREMRVLANVRHRYILPVYLAGIDGDLWWYTMKFVKGRSFKEALTSGKFAMSRGARVVAKVAHGMDFAHKNGVIHRDLKPQNVMLERDDSAAESDPNAREEPQILDFGLAKHIDANTIANLTQMGAFLGTPAYMAPEQAGGDPSQIDGRADVYALGAMLYEVLTGRPPFTGTSPANVIKKVLNEDPVPPRQVFPQAPAALEPICLRALKKDRDERQPTAGDLAAAIELVIGPEGGDSPRPGPSAGPPPAPDAPPAGDKSTKKSFFGKLFGG